MTIRTALAAFALAATVLALGSSRLLPNVCGVYHDDGIYVATAKALAEGHGYRLINLPGAPSQTKYPLLYPAVLATIWKASPEYPANLMAMQVFSLLCAAISVVLGYVYLVTRRYGTVKECFVASLICATSPMFLYFATQTLSEAMFSLLFVVSLWSIDSAVAKTLVTRTHRFWTGVASALPFLCRSIGLCLPLVALLRLRRKSIALWATLVGAALTMSPWLAWVAFNRASASTGDDVYRYYTAANYLGWWFTDASFLRVPLLNLFQACVAILMLQVPILTVPAVWPLVFAAGALVWREAILRRPTSVLSATLICYLIVVLVWPWPPDRFLVPLLPVLTLSSVLTAKRIGRFMPHRVSLVVLTVLATGIISANFIQDVRISRVVHQTGYPYFNIPRQPTHWKQYEETFSWIRNETSANAIIASGFDSMIFLYTGRRGFRPFIQRPTALFYRARRPPLGTVDEFAGILRQARTDYLVELPLPYFAEEVPLRNLIRETRTTWPDCLQVAHTLESDNRFIVYTVNAGACAGGR